MKRSILHIGGHADGEYRDVEFVEAADGSFHMRSGYTLRELKPIQEIPVGNIHDCVMAEAIAVETYYVRDQINFGRDHSDFYIDYSLRSDNPGAIVKALIRGYRKPKEV